jgi:DNA replication protein DnaC
MFAASGTPQRHLRCVLAESPQWMAQYKNLVDGFGHGRITMLVGPRGTGKTQLAVELIKHVCGLAKSALYIKAMGCFIKLRASYQTDGVSESQVIGGFVRPKLLVVDAMEERGNSQWEDRVLNHIIDLRYDAELDTVLISNLTQKQFDDSLGSSIVSRANESGGTVVCDWESFR